MKQEFEDGGMGSYLIHANSVLLTTNQVAVVFAPRDCSIFAVTNPDIYGVY